MQYMHQNKTRKIRVDVNNSEWAGNYMDYFLFNAILLFPTSYHGHLSYFTDKRTNANHWKWSQKTFSGLLEYCKLYDIRQVSNLCFIYGLRQFYLLRLLELNDIIFKITF